MIFPSSSLSDKFFSPTFLVSYCLTCCVSVSQKKLEVSFRPNFLNFFDASSFNNSSEETGLATRQAISRQEIRVVFLTDGVSYGADLEVTADNFIWHGPPGFRVATS